MTTPSTYPDYRPSGLEWLDKVPKHWELRRVKTILKERSEKGHPDEPLLAATQTKGVVHKEQYEQRTVLALKNLHLLKLVRTGDFVISLRSFQGGIEYAREQGIISPTYTVLYPLDTSVHGYLALLFKSKPYIENLTLHVTGIRQGKNIDYTALSRSYLPLPPPSEQRTIVRYLSHVDWQAQQYVSAKRKLIALLEEEKQAVVNQAVKRGLNPNVHLKSSGVKWIGDIPEHWEIIRVGHFARVTNGSTPSRSNLSYWTDGTHAWLNSSSVNQGTITYAEQFVTDLALRECHLPRLRPGSVLVGITGQGKTRGMSAVLSIEATINQHMASITPKPKRVSSPYLHMYLTAAYNELRAISSASGSTKAALTCEDIKHFKVVLPPIDEQQQLLSYVSRELVRVTNAINRARRQIELVQEYCTRLVADVVTGKLDVREAAARLP